MKFNGIAYEVGYWCARSGQPGLALSASMRVGYQHGSVDRTLDSTEVTDTLRERLRDLSAAHEAWRRAAKARDRGAQALASERSVSASNLLTDPESMEVLRSVNPALHSRLKIAPGINLVI
jgi:hypothetical protein